MQPLFTVGHGARSASEFAEVLIDGEIKILIDVRRFPGSRRHPHFGREALEAALGKLGIGYEWWGEELGGRRKPSPASRHTALRNESFRAYADHMESPEFQAALDEIERRAEGERLAVMCAETLWWKCHRRMIADALVARGREVIHLGLGDDKAHSLTPEARVVDDILVYDGPSKSERLF